MDNNLILLLLITVKNLIKRLWHNVTSVHREGEGEDTINNITLYTKSKS